MDGSGTNNEETRVSASSMPFFGWWVYSLNNKRQAVPSYGSGRLSPSVMFSLLRMEKNMSAALPLGLFLCSRFCFFVEKKSSKQQARSPMMVVLSLFFLFTAGLVGNRGASRWNCSGIPSKMLRASRRSLESLGVGMEMLGGAGVSRERRQPRGNRRGIVSTLQGHRGDCGASRDRGGHCIGVALTSCENRRRIVRNYRRHLRHSSK